MLFNGQAVYYNITEVFSTVPREKAVHTPLTACRSVCYNDFSRLTNMFLELYYPFFFIVYNSHFSRLQKRLLPNSIISRFTAFLEICQSFYYSDFSPFSEGFYPFSLHRV